MLCQPESSDVLPYNNNSLASPPMNSPRLDPEPPVPSGYLFESSSWDIEAGISFDLSDWVNHEISELSGVSDTSLLGVSEFPMSAAFFPGSQHQDTVHSDLQIWNRATSSKPLIEHISERDASKCSVSNDEPASRGQDHFNLNHNRRQRELKQQSNGNHSSGSASLLQSFYRLSMHDQISGFSDDSLVSHYFNHICPLFSAVDSEDNPLRTLVTSSLMDYPTIYFTIQSMAIGHLTNFYPSMVSLGIVKRSQAWIFLQRDLRRQRMENSLEYPVFLSLLLLGLSSAWHSQTHLGLPYLSLARCLMKSLLTRSEVGEAGSSRPEAEFFYTAMMYWEMLATFVDPVPITPFLSRAIPELKIPYRQRSVLPHALTGVANEVYYALAEIGGILRRRRDSDKRTFPFQKHENSISNLDNEWARSLENFLHSIEIPTEEDILDYKNLTVPKADLIQTAQAYRLVGLLEIYNAFPAILKERLCKRSIFDSFVLDSRIYHSAYQNENDALLVEIAINILDLVKCIPVRSSSCRLHHLLLVAAGSRLKNPDKVGFSNTVNVDPSHEITQLRYFVEARAGVLSRKYPQMPFLRMLEIIKEVWSKTDDSSDSIHWMDVMHDRGWQTLFA